MNFITEAFAMGGWMMWVILLLSLLTGAVSAVAAILILVSIFARKVALFARVASLGVLASAACAAAAGVMGTWIGWSQVQEALLLLASPDQRDALLAQGWYEAQMPMWFGGGVGLVGGAFGVALLVASFVAPRLRRE
jgi:hypothetical protein